uniref:hypothetical protein n=1 Tax=Thaumasiovibrio occultus TaxID=1891184 RepID=UPI000B355859|nr:hypothetical protein [Thaumasiovibrio occultus]
MKFARWFGYLLAVVTLVLLALGYLLYLYDLGFPDGHITDYAAAMSSVYKKALVPGGLLAVYTLYLARQAPQKNIWGKLALVLLVLVISVGVIAMVDNHFYLNLDRGQGG